VSWLFDSCVAARPDCLCICCFIILPRTALKLNETVHAEVVSLLEQVVITKAQTGKVDSDPDATESPQVARGQSQSVHQPGAVVLSSGKSHAGTLSKEEVPPSDVTNSGTKSAQSSLDRPGSFSVDESLRNYRAALMNKTVVELSQRILDQHGVVPPSLLFSAGSDLNPSSHMVTNVSAILCPRWCCYIFSIHSLRFMLQLCAFI
jgi:hypothetical protein